MNQERKRQVTLEDVLRLKRVERPPAEFWTRFDRELRTKQLAALVERHSWWSRLSGALARFGIYRLPLGAGAVLALSFVGVRHYWPESVPPAPEFAVESETSAAVTPIGGILNIEPAGPALADAVILPVYDVRDAGSAEPVDVAADVSSDLARESQYRISLLDPISDLQASDRIAANLAAAQAAEPVVARSLLGASRGFETRALPARTPAVDPLAQMSHPSEARRVRIQSAMVMMNSLDQPARSGARVASRISDERLYDQPQRLNGRGDRLSIKF
jgi:hypothetical protein